MKHTEGPWEARGARISTFVARIEGSNGFVGVAHGETAEEAQANACMMAAAPELLAMLRDLTIEAKAHLRNINDEDDYFFLEHNIEKAEAVIIKATGGMTDEHEYTSGPWFVNEKYQVEDGTGCPLAEVFAYGSRPAFANARLMAAAPELLAACLAAYQVVDWMSHEHAERLLMSEAIAKATGTD